MTPSATEKLIQVCEALDEKLACIVKDVETYQKTMNSIDESMRSGFMGLAQTRYAKGRDAVSLWKIPATMEARIGIDAWKCNDKNVQENSDRNEGGNEYSFSLRALAIANSEEDTLAIEQQQQYNAESRKRIGFGTSTAVPAPTSIFASQEPLLSLSALDDNVLSSAVGADGKDDKNDVIELPVMRKSTSYNNKKDPVFWFGVFTAASLRDPQLSFKKVLGHVCTLASLKHKIDSTVSEFQDLLKVKASLITSDDPLK